MDPRMIEINNLRVLNDYLNQTIDVLARSQRLNTLNVAGLSHSPFTGVSAPWTTTFDQVGLSHSPFAASAFATPYAYGATVPQAALTGFASAYPSVVDPFYAQRGLSHTPAVASLLAQQNWTSVAEITRLQQLNQAISARQSVLESICRTMGIPV